MKKLAFVALLTTLAAPAFAYDMGWAKNGYLVGSVGQSMYDTDQGRLNGALSGATGLSSSMDDNDTGYKLQVGYQFTPNIAVEGGYVDLGKTKYSASYTGLTVPATASGDMKVKGWNVAAVGTLPINEMFSVFAKLGAIAAKVETRIAAADLTTTGISSDSTKWKGNWGVGATWHVNQQVGVRIEYERFDNLGSDATGKTDVDLASVGVVFRF